MKPFEFLLAESTARRLLELPPEFRRDAMTAIESVARNPVTSGLPQWLGPDGRVHHLRSDHGWVVTFWVDHADRAVRIVAIDEVST